jgi:hypothetical protein
MADIFVSYSNVNRDRAKAIAAALEKCRWSVWWDTKIPIGSAFDKVIETEIKAARSLVVLWSRASVDSEYVKNEARLGIKRKILVPAMIESVELPLAFSGLQTADLSKWDAGEPSEEFEKVLARLRGLLDAGDASGPSTKKTHPPAAGPSPLFSSPLLVRRGRDTFNLWPFVEVPPGTTDVLAWRNSECKKVSEDKSLSAEAKVQAATYIYAAASKREDEDFEQKISSKPLDEQMRLRSERTKKAMDLNRSLLEESNRLIEKIWN